MYSSFVENGVFESNYLKGYVNIIFKTFLRKVADRKKDDKFTKINDNGNMTQDHYLTGTKESLYQKYSTRENKVSERPVRIY
jgi:hypothetical protein